MTFRAGGAEFLFNFLGNLAAFVPMGWLLLPSLLGRRWLLVRSPGLSLRGEPVRSRSVQGISGLDGSRTSTT